MEELHLFFDDSGVLHRNAPNRFFVYAGYAFIGKDNKEIAKRKYKKVVQRIQTKRGNREELKACYLDKSEKYELYRVLKNEHSMGLTVDIKRVQSNILDHKKSIHRYKDYVLKRLVKEKIKLLINRGLLNPEDDLKLCICVDEQATASNGYYNFEESVYEELKNGVHNFNYDVFYEPIWKGKLEINVSYCDSKHNYLIQASDILANRLWTSFKIDNREMRNIPEHSCMRLP
ncbi:DUF3800 domain-containing protein [Enterococcus faecium]|nr:DUF3800 domain-containing protein [Enterococcus faecium]EMF0275201.1 DUF3800 domain-containing protein [Enterococcus faecium]MDQ8526340.1 DUF3800 domain-containing protein [Enterococcus faecium]NTR21056.1 DUF3800 domain-containing protein [Enterococcus faecium]